MQQEKKISAYTFWPVVLLTLAGLIYFGGAAYQKYFGASVTAVVTAPAYNCDTRPRLPVRIGTQPQLMRLGRRACYDQRYTVGKVLQLKLHPFTGRIMADTAIPEVYFVTLLAVVVLAGRKRKSITSF
ncbi:hypothetical protein MKQ68_09570 [Chitinophaga horti]|uniref:DUF3592 domain-containing protein n=1 Tax=Chitinophaga horti TaxID=2920382 RepID=A0ABY6J6P7_9BACT|nr:hypothetical protein [Chitinophaga horti]UYQ95345.1 hypothetical protein MKQ68_09570 [Chitinophaga horti]